MTNWNNITKNSSSFSNVAKNSSSYTNVSKTVNQDLLLLDTGDFLLLDNGGRIILAQSTDSYVPDYVYVTKN